ncbi:TetR/AcrR family transcriptional regulator [Pseudothauera nasutitermitis]|uniref:TetR/AcrR family transcriptional regulator n=1 Tax=Pseudothauera nasutitermitis TaxID=2565930 RepID=UPI001454CD27|nr:TetR/AcrR family transcriptional regulator [Pseudothauera nasutitermitis]
MTTGPCEKKAARGRRRYLPSVERKREILDAALIEFSNHGYAAATMERIAARAGLSKAGIYAHYKSKDEVFEDLLETALSPSVKADGILPPEAGAPLAEIVSSYVDQMYDRLGEPIVMATFQLLIAESRREPALIRRWYDKMLEPRRLREQAVVDEYVRRGTMRSSALTGHFMLAASPLVMWIVQRMLRQDDDVPMPLEQVREAHKQLLLDVLEPR